MAYAPFHFFVDGGKAMFENRGEIDLEEAFLGDDGIELDQFVLDKFGVESPDYIRSLAAMSGVVK